MRFLTSFIASIALSAPALVACADEELPPHGTVTFRAEQGVDFRTGEVVSPANYTNSDIYGTRNTPTLKLASGGESLINERAITWFYNDGGLPRVFEGLDQVPTTKPTQVDRHASFKSGLGFVVKTEHGSYVRGWLEDISSESVTIQWERLP